jgi:hypothetical protein
MILMEEGRNEKKLLTLLQILNRRVSEQMKELSQLKKERENVMNNLIGMTIMTNDERKHLELGFYCDNRHYIRSLPSREFTIIDFIQQDSGIFVKLRGMGYGDINDYGSGCIQLHINELVKVIERKP